MAQTKLIYHPSSFNYNPGYNEGLFYPDSPDRVGLLEKWLTKQKPITLSLPHSNFKEEVELAILGVHIRSYLDHILKLSEVSGQSGMPFPIDRARFRGETKENLENIIWSMVPKAERETFVIHTTYEAACSSAAAAITAAQQAENNENAFAITRPGGHHAHANYSHGFCVFNNAAIAANYLADRGKRVFILDIDVHLGDGTLELTGYKRNLYFVSIHQSGLFPCSVSDEFQQLEKSEGDNHFCIPLGGAVDDDSYIKILDRDVKKRLEQFNPDIAVISAGFDSYHKDSSKQQHKIASMMGLRFELTKKTYLYLNSLFQNIPTVYILEGGYNPESVLEGVQILSGRKK